MPVQILAVSDMIDQRIHSSSLAERMPEVQLAVSCGDLPGRYLEFIVDALNTPLYYVLGNHAEEIQRDTHGRPRGPMGCIDIGGKVVTDPTTGLILAGLPGSPKYNDSEPEQYSEWEMSLKIAKMTPRLLWNQRRYGRALDVLVTHSPALDLGDREDEAHRGFRAIRTFLDRWKPAYHLHGHVHLYDRSQSPVLCYDETTIINVYPYQALELTVPEAERAATPAAPASPRSIRTRPDAAGPTTGVFSPLRVEGRGRFSGGSLGPSVFETVADRGPLAAPRERVSQPVARR
jgi:uncharacterized protein